MALFPCRPKIDGALPSHEMENADRMDFDHTEIPYKPEHVKMTESLVAEMRANDGLAPVDLDRFWADQETAMADPFGADIPQVPLGAILTGECPYDELGIEEDYWRYDNDPEWHVELNKAYNDKAERIVGRRLLREDLPDPDLKFDQETGHYQFGEINWQEFYDVLAGNGPCNKIRLAKRRKAHDDGAWVREAAQVYANKHSTRKVA